jgi:translation initiation factor 2B subunit (eIF-2B alpha/beta/delta family)
MNRSIDAVLVGLGRNSSIPERLAALSTLGLTPAVVAQSVGVSPEALRLWARGGSVRATNAQVLDNLRLAALTLLEASGDCDEVVTWLTSKPTLGAKRPLDLIRDRPELVLGAVEAHLRGQEDVAGQIIEEASATRRSPAAPPASALRPTSGPAELSSTQLNRQLVATLAQIAASDAPAQDVLPQIQAQHNEVRNLPNYHASSEVWKQIQDALAAADDTPASEAVRHLFTAQVTNESNLDDFFRDEASQWIPRDSGILTYALSMRVIQALQGASEVVRKSSTLYIAECRPRTVPRFGELPSLADAAATMRYLADTEYLAKYPVLDANLGSLMMLDNPRRVTLLMLGAQKIYGRRPHFTHFVGTAGTDMLLRVARDLNIKVLILAESSKLSESNPEDDFELRERKRRVVLPERDGSPSAEHAELLTIPDELCEIFEDANIEVVMDDLHAPADTPAQAA